MALPIAKKSKQERLESALTILLGAESLISRSSLYNVFRLTIDRGNGLETRFLYTGARGVLRIALTPYEKHSIAIPQTLADRLIADFDMVEQLGRNALDATLGSFDRCCLPSDFSID